MVRFKRMANVFDAAPHAIFWRPVRYFATYVRNEEDDLDAYEVASFDFGNRCQFDLRWYHGHPQFTASLYLSANLGSFTHTVGIVREIIEDLRVPARAVAWRRGQRLGSENLSRPPIDRLREPEARLLALKIAARKHDRHATTTEIKRELPRIYPLSELDLAPSTSRAREQRWQQIVGNVISHQSNIYSPFTLRYAVRTQNGLRVTQEGVDYLNNMGFSV